MSFYITLPSNTTSKHYDNTQSNYTTELTTPLSLDVPYEVALVEFSYREFLAIDIGAILFSFVDPQTGEFIRYDMIAYDNEPTSHFIDRINTEIVEFYTKILIIGYIADRKTVEQVYFDKVVNPEYYQVKYNESKRKCPSFTMHTSNLGTLTIPKGTYVKFLGHAQKLFKCDEKVLSKDHEITIYSELLNFIDYLMVYSDLVMQQRVGNTYAQLLRTITKTGEFNRTTEKIFETPQYLPLTKSYISTINIDIRYPTGEPAKFESLLSKVLVKLHFRPIKNEQ
jgi:hypothetical protein